VRLLFPKDNLAQEGGLPAPYGLRARLFTGVRGRLILGSSPKNCNKCILWLRGITMGMRPARWPATVTLGLVSAAHGW
jgi:hypothetical protein